MDALRERGPFKCQLGGDEFTPALGDVRDELVQETLSELQPGTERASKLEVFREQCRKIPS